MVEKLNQDRRSVNRVITSYYSTAESGYWNKLNGRCHYGFTPVDHAGSFDFESAQVEMERKLGETLGLPEGSRVLDAGCGWSPVARTLTEEFGYQVEGIDLMEERLRVGRQLNEEAGMRNIGQASADYHNLPFADGSFDGVYTMETLVHAASHEKVLGEFRRVLKPGGRLALFEYSIPDLNTIPRIPRSLAERVIENTGMTSLPHFTHGSWPRILEEAGFENVEAADISENVHPSWFYLWKFGIKNALGEFRKGKIGLDSVPGSAFIWPARKKLGYIISQANKPQVADHAVSDS